MTARVPCQCYRVTIQLSYVTGARPPIWTIVESVWILSLYLLFISTFSRRFNSYLTYAFTDMLLSLLLVSRTDRPVDDGLENTCPILAKYIYQSTFTGAPLNSRIRPIFRPMLVLVGLVDVSIGSNIQSFLKGKYNRFVCKILTLLVWHLFIPTEI